MAKMPEVFDSAFEMYTVKDILGEGGSGRVFLVTNEKGVSFALKCLFPDRVSTEKRKRFKNEVDFCSKLNHPNVIGVLDSGLVVLDKIKCPFYVMPVYPMTLRKLIEQGIGQDRVLSIFSQILNGVEAGHLSGVTHRDLKPENILYDLKEEKLAVADFGIAHFEEEIIATSISTKATTKLANLRYSAPEQRIPGSKVDRRADIFAAGLMLNEMFTREVPQGAGYKLIATVASQFSYLDPIVDRMIQQDPAARFSSLEEVKKELIARGNEFVVLQQLRAKEREVVPVSAVPETVPTTIMNVDWQRDRLTIRVSKVPEPGWIRRFQQPRENFNSIGGAHPSQMQFSGDQVSMYADERSVQAIVNYFKQYLEMADRGYCRDLEQEARSREQEARQQLVKEREEIERRARVLKNLKY